MQISEKGSQEKNLGTSVLEGTLLTRQCKWTFTKRFYPFYTTNKMPHVAVKITKKRFVGSNSQVYLHYGNLHRRLSAHFQRRAFLCCIFRSTQYKHERFEPNCRMPRRGKVLTKVLWMIANQQTRRNVD